MKRLAFISVLAMLLVSACSKPEPAPTSEQVEKYIFFSQNVDTKASLIGSTADMSGKTFGVVGFWYDNASSWTASKAAATPNVFAGNPPLAVACDANGYGTYSPLQGWSNSKEYTFFAFYPMPNDYVSLVNLDGTAYTAGVPAIKYSLDITDAAAFKASMFDVMTAPHHEDKYWRSASDNNIANGEVTMAFSHRLSSLGVNVKNSSEGAIQIQGIYLDIVDVQYQQIVLPLDGSPATASGNAFDIDQVPVGEAISLATGSTTELTDKVILIPQSSEISIELIVVYKRQFGNSAPSGLITFGPFSLTTVLTAGNKHMISLNFKDDTVEVESEVSAEGWIDMPDVEDTFN